MKAFRASGFAAAIIAVFTAPVSAQRVEFPTPLAQAAPPTPAPATSNWDAYADPNLPPAGSPVYSPSTAPYTLPPTNAQPTYVLPPTNASPTYAPPATYPTTPTYPSTPTYAPPGTIPPPGPYAAPPAGPYDPYAMPPPAGVQPYYAAPPAQPYYTPAPTAPGYLYPTAPTPDFTWPEPLQPVVWGRFLQEIRFSDTFMPDWGSEKVESNDIETSATFAIRPWWNAEAPLYITPGFGLHLWDGPPSHGPGSADLPPETYDAYLDAAWNPHPTPLFGAELGARVGVYTAFDTIDTQSIRIMGRALGVFNYTPTTEFKLGAVYIDRNKIKLLPAGGLFYTPNPDTKLELFFPNPKFSRRFTTTGTYQWWWYIVGEYGGGAWTIKRADGATDDVDYNDIRASLGIEWLPETTRSAVHGYFEVGYATDRNLVYRDNPPLNLDLHDTILCRAGLAY